MTFIDQLNRAIGKAVSWLTLFLVLIIVIVVILRYSLSITSAISFELEWHLFGIIFLLGASWALQEDQHVRVDVFYHKFSDVTKAWVNLIGTMILLWPFCGVVFWESLSFVESSYLLNEISSQPDGLPMRYLIKSVIPTGFILLGIQGFSVVIKSVTIIMNGRKK